MWALPANQSTSEIRTAKYFDSIRTQPLPLLAFLREMPKGGDLHNHLFGAVNAEKLIAWAATDGLCINRADSQLVSPPCSDSCADTAKPSAACAFKNQSLYNAAVDAWSMRNWQSGRESGHDHFFATFDKFVPALQNHVGDALAEAVQQAAFDRAQYVELMHTADGMGAGNLARNLTWDDDFAKMRTDLLAHGLGALVQSTRKQLDADESTMRSGLKCGSSAADSGCNVTVRYLYQVLRGLPREIVYCQILMGFELAKADPRFVGLNLVMPEDAYVPMRDFHLHMTILDYLHGIYPDVHISLHAGELASPLVPPAHMRSHILDSIEVGHAERIGHGVDVMNEDSAVGLLREMKERNILVEICLTSNEEILGVTGEDHPFKNYRAAGVPLALATDDEGVSRSDLTHEFLRAAQTYKLSYRDLKNLARASLEHSFLPGASLWHDSESFRPVASCATGLESQSCKHFLARSERARSQASLEANFSAFENRHQ